MGKRKAEKARLEEPYTLEVETPHVKWAKPLPGGPIRLLAVPSVQEGRTLVELAQRISLDLTTVTIDPAWDNNKWTMAFGDDYGARAERGDLNLVYGYLEEELTSEKEFDVILLPLHHGWEALTEKSKKALEERVREGTGLVLVRPLDHVLSPLIPVEKIDSPAAKFDQIEPESEQSSWRRVSSHWIVKAIPIESFPFRFLENYQYKLAPEAEALVISDSGVPVIASQKVGKGRVIGFGYRNIGLSWRMSDEALGQPVDLYWEYFYSLLARALIYASGREPSASFDPSGVTHWKLKTEDGRVLREGSRDQIDSSDLLPGRYFLEQHSDSDWMISLIENPLTDRIAITGVSPPVITEGDSVQIRYDSSGPGIAKLMDGFGRIIAEGDWDAGGRSEIVLKAGRPLTHGGFAVLESGSAQEKKPVLFAVSSRMWDDYEIIMPWYGPGSYQPWTPTLDDQFRKIGITTLEDPERNFRIIASIHEPAFGIYWYRKENYEKRKAEYLKTGDKSLIRRDVSLHDPSLDRKMRERFQERAGELIPLKPFAYYLADESSLTCYADAFDVDFSPEALAEFRTWLQNEYSGLGHLNESWGTDFQDWESVAPMTSTEVQKHGNYASWSDHRVFMEEVFLRTIRAAGKIAKEFDPGARASFSGTQIPAPHNGANWYEIDQITDYLQPYSGGNQDPMHFLFNPSLLLTGFTGYGLVGEEVQYQVWQRLFYGHSGASIFWHYTLLNPDLTLSPQGKALAKAFSRIQSGIGRIFMNSTIIEDGAAIHFSMASIRGAWITDGKIVDHVVSAQRTSEAFDELMKRRDQWVSALETRGIQFRFLATPQIEAGDLDKYKTLILPYSIALSGREISEIEKFAEKGGKVFIDEQTGRMDEKLRWRKSPVWTKEKLNFFRSKPEQLNLRRSIDIEGDHLTTIRRFGGSRLFGLLPKESGRVQLPDSDKYQYDILRSELAKPLINCSPEDPVLILERDTRIASIQISSDLTVKLTDEQGSPIDRSVVSVEVFDPTGKFIHYYSKNIDIVEGKGQMEIPFALNSPRGDWKIQVRDVISGLTDELILVR